MIYLRRQKNVESNFGHRGKIIGNSFEVPNSAKVEYAEGVR